MAYSSTLAQLNQILPMGIAASPSTGAAITAGGSLWRYCSSHTSTQIIGAGFFAACGSGYQGLGQLARSPNNVGLRVGDIVLNVESSGGVLPGKVSWHAAIASTFNQASSNASTGNGPTAGFDVTVSSATT